MDFDEYIKTLIEFNEKTTISSEQMSKNIRRISIVLRKMHHVSNDDIEVSLCEEKLFNEVTIPIKIKP